MNIVNFSVCLQALVCLICVAVYFTIFVVQKKIYEKHGNDLLIIILVVHQDADAERKVQCAQTRERGPPSAPAELYQDHEWQMLSFSSNIYFSYNLNTT